VTGHYSGAWKLTFRAAYALIRLLDPLFRWTWFSVGIGITDGRLFEQLASGCLCRSLALMHPAARQVPVRGLLSIGWILRLEQQHAILRVDDEDACDLPGDRSESSHPAHCVEAPPASQLTQATDRFALPLSRRLGFEP
jgi:hypothetical protein